MEKKFICPVDKRQFASKKALAQHRASVHGGNPQKGQAVGAGRGRRRNAGNGGGGALANTTNAQPQRVLGRAGRDEARVSGVDRLFHVTNINTIGDGQIVYNAIVSVGLFKRLRVVASAFQHVVYEKLVFRVEPQISAMTSGGYVAGFITDPDDSITTLDELTAAPNSVTTKWWQSATVNGNPSRKDYYVMQTGEPRTYSPGMFSLMSDGKATQAGSLTIFCEWSVRLHGAALEPPPTKIFRISKDLWSREGKTGLFGAKVVNPDPTKDGDWEQDPEKIITGAKAGASFLLPFPLRLEKPEDAEPFTFHWLYVHSIGPAGSLQLAQRNPTDAYNGVAKATDLLIVAPTNLTRVDNRAPAALNSTGSLSNSQTMTQTITSESCSPDFSTLISQLNYCLSALSQNCPQSRDRLDSEASAYSMVYPPE